MLAEILDLLLEVQEAEQDQVGAGVLEREDAFGDLLRRSDQVGAEAVVVLHKIVEGGLCPVAFPLGRGQAGVLDLVAERVDGFRDWLFR